MLRLVWCPLLVITVPVVTETVSSYSCSLYPGTTANIETIFGGRCRDYTENMYPKSVCGNEQFDCDALWDTFADVFTNKSVCNMTAAMYSELLGTANHSVPMGKSMFWQGVFGFVQELSYQGKRYFTLEDTLYGYTLNKLNWCWSETVNDFNYTYCPNTTSCPLNALSAYWEGASRQFAKTASGSVRVMLNGSRIPVYNQKGFFGRVELPAIDKSKVDKITILLVHFIGAPVVENCDGVTVTQLKSDIKKKGIPVDCIDDPSWIHFYLCVDFPDSAYCKLTGSGQAISSGLSFIFTVFCSFLVYMYHNVLQ